METQRERFIVDSEGKRVEVILPVERYTEMLEAVEELDCIAAYDAAKASGEKPVSFKEAMKGARRKRK